MNTDEPLSRFWVLESEFAQKIVSIVARDLATCESALDGKEEFSNTSRELVQLLGQGLIPKAWIKYPIPAAYSAAQFIDDLQKRLEQNSRIIESQKTDAPIWLGGIFQLETFLMITRNASSIELGASLESLVLTCRPSAHGVSGFQLDNIKIQGALLKDGQLVISESVRLAEFQQCALQWTQPNDKKGDVQVPLYLNTDRTFAVCQFIFSSNCSFTNSDALKSAVALFV